MNIPLLPSSIPAPVPHPVKRKRVLLIDSSHASRDLRAEIMRKRGLDVDSAADMAEARIWWRPALYDLVLINMEKGRGQRDKFCEHVRSATPPQLLAFLVGGPAYLTYALDQDQELAMQSGDEKLDGAGAQSEVPADPPVATRRWGILEASRQISAVRSASLARRQAKRAIPPPPRDSEAQWEKLRAAPASLDDLLREEHAGREGTSPGFPSRIAP
ncbi:MAG TPA: response regulator [Terriglobales bacterium]